MPPGRITEHLARILETESVPFEPGALRYIAHAASGSMRDALSLLDQAIAHGAGHVLEEQVTHMLGAVGEDHLYAILDALAGGDADALLAVADDMESRSLSFEAALQALASLLARVSLAQFAPGAIAEEGERAKLLAQAQRFDAEYLQLAYQITIHGRDELPLAPDEYTGFTMSLLRLLAFRPEQPSAPGAGSPSGGDGSGRARPLPTSMARPADAASGPSSSGPSSSGTSSSGSAAPGSAAPGSSSLGSASSGSAASAFPPSGFATSGSTASSPATPGPVSPAPVAAAGMNGNAAVMAAFERGDWREVVRTLGLSGLARECAQHCEWVKFDGARLYLRLSEAQRHILEMNRTIFARIESELARALGRPVSLDLEAGTIAGQTPAQLDELDRRERHAQAVAALESDPFVREMIERFDASLSESTARLL
jgi:DNA polymerase-3 subunit gamma/tau